MMWLFVGFALSFGPSVGAKRGHAHARAVIAHVHARTRTRNACCVCGSIVLHHCISVEVPCWAGGLIGAPVHVLWLGVRYDECGPHAHTIPGTAYTERERERERQTDRQTHTHK